MYVFIAKKFGYTFEQIADMTPTQHKVLLGQIDNTLTFADSRAYTRWRMDQSG